jgi:DNA-binding response OmpR family regulator
MRPTSIATYERPLRRTGYRVVSAGTRGAGLALVEREPLVLAITDIHLPDGDGLDVVRAVRQLPALTPAIVVTDTPFEASRRASLAAGAAAFLAKPFAISTFLSLVENALVTR